MMWWVTGWARYREANSDIMWENWWFVGIITCKLTESGTSAAQVILQELRLLCKERSFKFHGKIIRTNYGILLKCAA